MIHTFSDPESKPPDSPTPGAEGKPGLTPAQGRSVAMAVLFIAGWLILLLNVCGLMLTMRSSRVGDPALFYFPDDVTLTDREFWDVVNHREENDSNKSDFSAIGVIQNILHYWEGFWEQLNQPESGDRIEAIRLTFAVNQAMLHYWDEDGMGAIPLRVPWWENYWLWLASYVKPEIFRQYEFMDARKAVERGVGLCSQQALVLEQLLERRGIEAEIVGLDGHVVVTARIKWDTGDSAEWLLDPDYGVIIPHSLAEVESQPDLIRPCYEFGGYSAEQIETLTGIYGPAGNRRFAGAREWYAHKYWFERASYAAKWALPLLLMAPWMLAGYWKARRKGQQGQQGRQGQYGKIG